MVQTHTEEKNYRYFDIIMAAFVTILVVSNVASSAKIIDLRVSIAGLPLAFDAGTLLFPVSYIFGDILTEVYGYKRSRKVIWTGFFCLVMASAIFWMVSVLPGEAMWQGYAGDAAYGAILGGMSSGGIVLGSLAGYWGGEFTNSAILARLKVMTAGRFLWLRTISSTLAGELVDSLLFVSVAILFGIFPRELFMTLVVTNYLFKTLVEVAMTPLTYLAVNHTKKVEQVDHYDRDTNFSPFAR